MRLLNRKERGVSPVIATILMVAITVVLAATLYMMLPDDANTDDTNPLSGGVDDSTEGWLVEINGGSVDWDEDKIQLYNTSTGASVDYTNYANNPGTGDANLTFDVEGTDVWVVWNDNDGNGEINSGDSFRIIVAGDPDEAISNDMQFRIANTNLRLDLE
ncbi:MAG: type IV pilin [Candidatus Thermoplasmatota archaeon]|nr:type IV pilin [Candidatus Thermoplasmatota archaeon]